MDNNNKERLKRKGEGIRGMDSTTLFRITNFELFVKNNKYVMSAGIATLSLCLGYIFYMNWKVRNDPTKQTYIATAEDGSQLIQTRKSRWD